MWRKAEIGFLTYSWRYDNIRIRRIEHWSRPATQSLTVQKYSGASTKEIYTEHDSGDDVQHRTICVGYIQP